ncbi:MAG: hypothetical protein R3F54_18890 [Alphaproteobacteria bacterium]
MIVCDHAGQRLSMGFKQSGLRPPDGSGSRLPVVSTRISLIAADGLTEYRRAACLTEPPLSTASTSRPLKSNDNGAGIIPTRLSQPTSSNHRDRFHAIGKCSKIRDGLYIKLVESQATRS